MKSISALALLALALNTTTADAQSATRTSVTTTVAAAPAYQHFFLVKLWHSSTPLTAAEQTTLAKQRAAYKGKKVEVMALRWSTQEELLGILHKFFGDVQIDPENADQYKVNGSTLNVSKKKGSLLIGDDHLVLTAFGKPETEITNYLSGAVK